MLVTPCSPAWSLGLARFLLSLLALRRLFSQVLFAPLYRCIFSARTVNPFWLLGVLSHMFSFLYGSFFCMCWCFFLLRRLSSLSITKLKWLSCRSLAFSVFLLHFKITVFGFFQYLMELHLYSLVSDMVIASSLTVKSAQQVLCNLSK